MKDPITLSLSARVSSANKYVRGGALAIALLVLLPTVAIADDGFATWYGPGFQGNAMANGQIYDMYDPTTAASNRFAFGTWVKVTNPVNGRTVVVQVRDRGGFSYALDLSFAAFKLIANPALMGIPVRYQVVSGPSGADVPPPAARTSPSSTTSSATYVVQLGDTLGSIALQTHLDAGLLATWNGITDPNLLVVGRTLRLTASSAAAPTDGQRYVVQEGDSLLAIASRFGVSADGLASANGIADPSRIQLGKALTIPSKPGSGAARTYVVQSGDTISGIAQKFGVSEVLLLSSNHLSDPNSIAEGQSLTIP